MMKEKINKLIEISEYLNDNESVIQLKRLSKSLEDNGYILSFMGQFSAGKSSLINNLFGKQILPVHKTETTARITFIKYGEEECVELVYSDGHSDIISVDESLDIWQTGDKSALLTNVETINISLPSKLLKNGLIIADTPGTNTVIEKHIELTESLITNSDKVLYVLGKQITETDISFVNAIKKFGTEVVFVRSYMDQIKRNEEDINRTIEKEKELLSKISSEEVFFISNECSSEFYNEIYSLQAYISCGISENITNAVNKSVAERIDFITKKQEGKLLDRHMQLSMILNNENEEYKQNKFEVLDVLERLEKNLEQKRSLLKDKVVKEKISSKEELAIIKKSEEKKLISKINNTPDEAFTSKFKEEIGEAIRDSGIRMRDNFVDCFDKIIRDNKISFLQEMKNNKELSVWIPDIPENIDESELQINSLKHRMESLKIIQSRLQEELNDIDGHNKILQEKNSAIEEERKAITESIETIKHQLDSFPPYVAKYITVEGDHSCEKGFKIVGNILDWATIFIPGPTWAKLGGKVLNASAKGAKAIKAVKAADAFADGARILAKVAKSAESGKKIVKSAKTFEKSARAVVNTIDVLNKGKKAVLTNKLGEQLGTINEEIIVNDSNLDIAYSPDLPSEPKPTLLDYIGMDYWFAKIGKSFDIPDTQKVDLEYEKKYFSAKSEIEKDMRLQVRKEFEKRKQQEELKSKEDENILLKEIKVRKEKAAENQIRELEKEIENEKRSAVIRFIKNYYSTAVTDNLNHIETYILEKIFPEVEEKMYNYINTYDFRIKGDIDAKKQELDDLDRKYNSSERAGFEKENLLCKEYLNYLESVDV